MTATNLYNSDPAVDMYFYTSPEIGAYNSPNAIDDFRLYDYALSDLNIAWDMAHSVPLGPLPPVQAPTSPVLAYNFDEGSGSTFKEASGGPTGVFIGTGVSFASGHTGTAVTTDGSANGQAQASIGANLPFSTWTGITFSCWVKVAGNAGGLLSGVAPDGTELFCFEVNNSSVLGRLRTSSFYGNTGSTDTGVAIGSWVHVALTWDSSSKIVNLWANGGIVTSFNSTSASLFNRSLDSIIFGWGNGTVSARVIDDFRLYNYALSQPNISYDMANPVINLPTVAATPPAGVVTWSATPPAGRVRPTVIAAPPAGVVTWSATPPLAQGGSGATATPVAGITTWSATPPIISLAASTTPPAGVISFLATAPVVRARPLTGTFTWWDGVTEIPLTVQGVWVSPSVVPVTVSYVP